MAALSLSEGYMAPMFLVLMMLASTQGLLNEPGECGRYQFQEKMLEKMVVLDHTMKVTLTDLETKLSKYENENAKLKEDLALVTAELQAEVKKSNEALVAELDNLRDNYKKVTNMQSAQQQQLVFGFNELRTNISEEMKTLVEKVDDAAELGGAATHEPVAFNAYLSGGDTNPSVGRPIVFSQEVQNYAHAYSTSDGMFTPPVAGVYYISVQMCMSQKDRVEIQIVSENRIYAAGAFREEYDATCSSMTTVAVLEKGEKLWVKCVSSDDNVSNEKALEGDTPTKFRTMFNGVLIRPIA